MSESSVLLSGGTVVSDVPHIPIIDMGTDGLRVKPGCGSPTYGAMPASRPAARESSASSKVNTAVDGVEDGWRWGVRLNTRGVWRVACGVRQVYGDRAECAVD